jgi:hypothetical protein
MLCHIRHYPAKKGGHELQKCVPRTMYLRCSDNFGWLRSKPAGRDYSRLGCGVQDMQLGPAHR